MRSLSNQVKYLCLKNGISMYDDVSFVLAIPSEPVKDNADAIWPLVRVVQFTLTLRRVDSSMTMTFIGLASMNK